VRLALARYFCMEFMLSEALPIYSGGLGNVAGDQLKAASAHGRGRVLAPDGDRRQAGRTMLTFLRRHEDYGHTGRNRSVGRVQMPFVQRRNPMHASGSSSSQVSPGLFCDTQVPETQLA
jgi:hypothetical protein